MEHIAYLPLEIKQRDLDSRLLIAAHLLRFGVTVVIGQQWALFANPDTLPPGVVLFKTVNGIQATCMANFRAAGHLVAATDEEVLVLFQELGFLDSFSDIAAESCDLFFAQNALHNAAVEGRFPSLRGKTAVVGSSRLDFLSPHGRKSLMAEAESYKAAHGPYVLFNMNYGQINTIWLDQTHLTAIAAQTGLLNLNDPISVERYYATLEWERCNQTEMVDLLHWAVGHLPGHKLVIRPHPVERLEFWQERFGGFENVVIVPRSNPYPWMLGAALVVHTECTTGLEAALLDRPVLNLSPRERPGYQHILNRVNATVANWQDASVAMESFLNAGSGPLTEQREGLAKALSDFFPGHAEGVASGLVAQGIEALLSSRGSVPDLSAQPLRFRGPGFRSLVRPEVLKDKFTLPPDELVARFRSAANVAGLNANLNVSVLDDSLYIMAPRSTDHTDAGTS